MKILKLIFVVLIAIQGSAFAQTDKVAVALAHLQNSQFQEAKIAIDEAVLHEVSSLDSYAWYVRGFIYKEIFKANERSNPLSKLREESLASFRKSLELDKTNEHKEDNEQNLKYLANTYFNDVVLTLNPENYPTAIQNFGRFKEIKTILQEQEATLSMEIDFKLALASVYTKIFESDRKENEGFFDKTAQLYKDILEVQPDNVSANYNLGILYYNKAVNIIHDLKYDMDIFEFVKTQDATVEIFKQSLPYMEKAYQLEPDRKETLIGLEGIYFSLHEMDKSNEIKARLEQLD